MNSSKRRGTEGIQIYLVPGTHCCGVHHTILCVPEVGRKESHPLLARLYRIFYGMESVKRWELVASTIIPSESSARCALCVRVLYSYILNIPCLLIPARCRGSRSAASSQQCQQILIFMYERYQHFTFISDVLPTRHDSERTQEKNRRKQNNFNKRTAVHTS